MRGFVSAQIAQLMRISRQQQLQNRLVRVDVAFVTKFVFSLRVEQTTYFSCTHISVRSANFQYCSPVRCVCNDICAALLTD